MQEMPLPGPEVFFWPVSAPTPDEILLRFGQDASVFFMVPPDADTTDLPRLEFGFTLPRQSQRPPHPRARRGREGEERQTNSQVVTGTVGATEQAGR
jgi:hypothetical protein